MYTPSLPALAATALLAVASFPSVEAFWRLPCGNTLVTERADSIVSSGAVSGHVHTILGGSNFQLQTTFADLRASECTSCLVKQDMSNYWTPQMYFQWKNGSFSSVDTTGGGLIYYLPRNHSSDTTKVMAFPDGLKMLTGNPFKRSYNASSDQDQAIGWNCLGGPVPTGTDTRQPYLPPYNCPNGLRGEIRFPSCWNGKDIDSTDHFSHMAYPIGGESGPCPSTHKTRVVTLFYEIMWSVDPFNAYRSQALNSTQPLVLAMGDSSGYGYHGDFFNGWDGAVLQEAIDTCTSASGVIEYCEVFDLYDDSHMCRQTPQVNEVVTGLLPSLPGCNPVSGAGPNATPCSLSTTPPVVENVVYTGSAPPATAIVPANVPTVLLRYAGPTSGRTYNYQECYSDNVNGARVLPNGLTNAAGTAEGCIAACDAKGYGYCGLEYHGECWGANSLAAGSAIQSGVCGLTCSGNPLQLCGGSGGVTGSAFSLYTRSDVRFAARPQTTTSSSTTTTTTSKTTTTTVAPSTTTTSKTTTTTSKTTTTTTTTTTTKAATSTITTTSKPVFYLAPLTTITTVKPTTTTTTTTSAAKTAAVVVVTPTTTTTTKVVWYIAPTAATKKRKRSVDVSAPREKRLTFRERKALMANKQRRR